MNRLLVFVIMGLAAATVGGKEKPNVLFFLVDDLGWMDLGCYGSEFHETPRIDAFAKEGVRFTQAYAAHSKCIGSRIGLMSGKLPARLGNPGRRESLPATEKTMAEAFREQGYSTFFAGKWHLGKNNMMPENQGFDVNRGGGHNGYPATYFYPYQVDDSQRKADYNVEGLEGGQADEYLTDRLTDETISFIRSNKDRPFFAYLSHYAVHEPIEAKTELVEKYEEKLKGMDYEGREGFVFDGAFQYDAIQDNPVYAAMLESVDESLGRLLDVLEDEGLTENTIVVVTSDNGGKSHNPYSPTDNKPTSNLPLRAGKVLMWEGGLRVPMIVKWPGKGQAGATSDAPTIGTDHYASLLEMAGLSLCPEQHLDSASYVPLLSGDKMEAHPPMFWNFPQSAKRKEVGYANVRAVRLGDYKLIEWWEEDKAVLYNISQDIEERNDLAATMPEKTAELRALLKKWAKDVDAPMLFYGK